MSGNVVAEYPSINPEDFRKACIDLEEKGRIALSRQTSWVEISSCQANDDFALRIRKRLSLLPPTGLAPPDAEAEHEADNEDNECFERTSALHYLLVDFWITLSPTYRCPVLWFNFSSPMPEGSQGFEAVYSYLVPAERRRELENVGIIGGISMAAHPLTDLPAYFIHPCNTPSALSELKGGSQVSPSEYLSLWLGLVGPCVGLHIPSSFVTPITETQVPARGPS